MKEKISKFSELSDDINDSIFDMDIEKLKNGEYEIDSIINVSMEIPDNIKLEESNVINFNSELGDEIKRGEKLYIVALIRKKGTNNFTSPAQQAVISCRIIDIYHGLSYLNRIIK